MIRIRQALWSFIDWAFRLVGIELTLTCNFCDQEIAVENYTNHMTSHKVRKDRRG